MSKQKRLEAEDTLRKRELHLRRFYESGLIGVIDWNMNGQILDANQKFLEMVGYTREDLTAGRINWAQMTPPEYRHLDDASVAELKATGVNRTPFEKEYIRKDGTRIPIILAGAMLDEERFRGVAFVLDITERRRADKALIESEEKFRSFFEMSVDLVCIADISGHFRQINKSWPKVLGYSEEEILSRPFMDFIHPDDKAKTAQIIEEKLRQGETILSFENRYVRKDGVIVWLEWTSQPAGDRTFAIARDVTERKRTDEALLESNQLFRRLVDGNIIGVVVANREHIIEANDVFLRMIDYTRDELERDEIDWLKMTPPEHADADRNALEELLSQGSCRPFEKEYFRKDGSRVPFIIGASLISREPLAWICFILDITARKHTEEALRKTEENFRRSMDDSPMGIRIVSAEGETLYANRTILGLYGYDDIEELRSAPVKKRYTAASYAEYQLRKRKRIGGEEGPTEYQISIVKKTGEIRCLQVFRKIILWDGLPRDQTIYQDITKHKIAEDKVRETLTSLRSALSGIIQVLSAATEKRDPYTAGHQRRVADLARAIARELGLSQDRVEGIRVAGVIHDIGKLSIPAEILSKPTRLSKIEYALIQSHPQIGHEILGEVEFPWPVAQIILQHHERMDGSGYPQQLKRNDILLEARILAVADVIEAMASHRPYRPALGIEAALREIENDKGVRYDPAVVSACLRLFREKGYTLKD